MTVSTEEHRVRLSVNVDPELRRQLKIVASQRDQSVREFVEGVLAAAIAGADTASARQAKRAPSRSLGAGEDAELAARDSKAWLRDHWADK